MSVAVLGSLVAGALAAVGLLDVAAAFVSRARARARPVGASARVVAPIARLGRRVALPGAPADLRSRLDAAGSASAVADVMALKVGAGLAGLGAALLVAPSLPGRLGLLAPPAAAAAGFLAPDLQLRRRTGARRRVMAAELADVLDLLRVVLAAGLPVNRALAEVGRRHPGTLAAEFERTARRHARGASRRDALAELGRRLPITQATALTSALDRAGRHGVPPDEALASLATDARATSARAANERAARAAPQIQLVVALGLVPAALLLVAAGLLPALT